MSQRLRDLKGRIEKLRNKVENLKPTDNLSQSQDEVEEIDQEIQNTEDAIKEIDDEAEDDEELSTQKPLMDKFNEYKNDFEIIRNKYNKKKDEVMSAHNKELLMQGKLHGVEKKKAARDMALDQMKNIDEHELMIDDIAQNVKDANANIANMNVEVKNQGERLKNVDDKVIQMDQTVKKTEERFGGMEKRIFCRKFLLWLGIVILLLANIVIAFLIIARGAGWPPFRDDKGNNGLDMKQNENNVNFEDAYKNKNYTMIMIQAGSGTKPYDRLISVIKALKKQDLEAGIYWTIENDAIEVALQEADAAAVKVKEANDEGIKFGFYFMFNDNNNSIIKDYNLVSRLCDKIGEKVDCGLALSYHNYKTYYQQKLKEAEKIKKYWVNSQVQDTDVEKESKVQIWNVNGISEYTGCDKLKYK